MDWRASVLSLSRPYRPILKDYTDEFMDSLWTVQCINVSSVHKKTSYTNSSCRQCARAQFLGSHVLHVLLDNRVRFRYSVTQRRRRTLCTCNDGLDWTPSTRNRYPCSVPGLVPCSTCNCRGAAEVEGAAMNLNIAQAKNLLSTAVNIEAIYGH